MARYVEIATVIARRVRFGELAPDAELPAVREAAHAHATTSSTIVRAYRHLADAAVITLGDRRRAKVAPGGALAAAALLDGNRVLRLAGSDDPDLHVLLDHVGPAAVTVTGTRGSFPALRTLARGDADGAAIHLRHHSGVYNAPFVRALLRGRDPHLLHLWRREQGLLVPAGNPRRITTIADLSGLRVARRENGAGTRVLLDQELLAVGVSPENLAGPELHSHLETALAVAAGIADVALGLRCAATDLDLDFVPVTWESYDIALPAATLGAAAPLVRALHDHHVRAAITALGGYDLRRAGALESAAT